MWFFAGDLRFAYFIVLVCERVKVYFINMEAKRVPNFTYQEKQYLINLISQKYADIIEDKRTNRTSIDEKKDVWNKIEKEFNASGPLLTYRSAESLRRMYENKKKELRKKLGEEKKLRLQTGGGPMTPIVLDDIDKILIAILNEKCLTGLANTFDCDAEEGTIEIGTGNYEFIFNKDSEFDALTDKSCTAVTDNKLDGESGNANKAIFCKNPNLDPNIQHRNIPEDRPVSAENVNLNWTKLKVQNLKHPISSALKNQENPSTSGDPDSTPIIRKTNRRRPMLTRTLTTSDISEKYNLLLDKRLILLNKQLSQQEEHANFQKEEQKLKLHLLRLEIEYKKTLLKNNFGIDF